MSNISHMGAKYAVADKNIHVYCIYLSVRVMKFTRLLRYRIDTLE
jgi:hypothetical protein